MSKLEVFEGWYFKLQNGDTVLAFIPGQCIDKKGAVRTFLQIIWNETSFFIDFKAEEYQVNKRRKAIHIGNNIFSKRGIKVDIRSKDITIKGIVHHRSLSPLHYPIMGPFQLVPFMECKHEVISMSHSLQGKIRINKRVLDFNGEKGYIEGDRGSSFPESYLWMQCNQFEEECASLMVSIGKIPFLKQSFQGCICVIHYRGKGYRFATYLGAKVICCHPKAIVLNQGNYQLKVYVAEQMGKKNPNFSHNLLAPGNGRMNRLIKEEHLMQGRFLLYKKGKLIFDLFSNHVSYECVEK